MIELARQGKVRAAIVMPAGFGAEAPRALMLGGAKPVVAVHYDPSQATAMTLVRGLLTQHVMKALGDSLGGGAGAGASRLPASFSLPFTTEPVESTARRDAPLQQLCALVRRHGRPVHPVHGHRGRRRRAAGAAPGPVEAAARGAALAQPAARQPHRQRRDHGADPARHHLRRGDRASSTSASTAASPASSASPSPSRC